MMADILQNSVKGQEMFVFVEEERRGLGEGLRSERISLECGQN